MDVYGKALSDFYEQGHTTKLWLHNSYGQPEDMPVEVFFRDREDISELEEHALSLCRGKILDIGAGTGVHTLILQAAGYDVTALEVSGAACQLMADRGVRQIVNRDIIEFDEARFDTLLLLMNGIGLCGDIFGLNALLPHLKKLLNKGGQIILDSSDISYLYSTGIYPKGHYYGEISYQYEYKEFKGNWFKWLYIDFDYLSDIAKNHGMACKLVFEDDMDQYLARLTNAD